MPIARGEEWGEQGTLPPDAPVAQSDVEAARLVRDGHRVIGLSGGDLARTLGVRTPYDRSAAKHLVPVDVLAVDVGDGEQRLCVAHVLVGRFRARRQTAAIMNAAFVGRHNLAPRAHPGDGVVDVVRFDLGLVDRIKAERRMPTGSHVPHPGITITRDTEGVVEFDGPQRVQIDGRACGSTRRVAFRVLPEPVTIGV